MKLVVLLYIFSECACTLSGVVKSIRLPTDVTPSHYSIRIHPNIEKEYFDGEVTINVKSRNTINEITLHSAHLNISEANINRIPAKFEHQDDEKLSLSYDNASIQPGEHVLYIKYQGLLLKDGPGFYKAPFQYNGEVGFLLVTDFEPSSARKAFPCFDEPAFKSKFNIRIVVPNDTYTAISNMEEINRFTTSYGTVYDFATSVTMSTYLVSFAVTNYPYYEEILEETNRNVPIRVYTYNASQENNHFAIDCAKKALKFYSAYTGISYPLSKLDMIEFDRTQSAATENWGLITFREGLLTLNLEIFVDSQIKTVMFHELAHFWFGNLVTNDWWNDIWLQEGFATYMSYKLDEADAPEKVQTRRNILFDAFEETDSEVPTKPIVEYLITQKDIEKRFDSIIYDKGAAVISMLHSIIGERAFQEVIRTFLKRHAYKTVTTNDFISTVEEVVPHVHIRSFIETYLYQNRFPILNVSLSNGKFVLQQQVCPTTAKFSTSGEKWTIPLTYITNINKTTTFKWFDKDADYMTIDVPDAKWILFNTKTTGIYRVLYSNELWNILVPHFQELSEEEGDFLISEAIYAFKYGYIDCDIIFGFMKSITKRAQWVFFSEFHYIMSKEIICNSSEDKDIYKNFMMRRINETKARHPKNLYSSDIDCSKPNKETNMKLKSCVKWIRENLQ